MRHRIVITGAGGQVGGYLAARAARQGREVLALTSAQWDITDGAVAEQIVRTGDVVINCAAYTDVDAAEADQQRVFAVNATGPGLIAAACARAGARMIHISTDYVFNGDFGGAQPRPYEVDDEPEPLSVYGCSKLAGETAVLSAMPTATVVRTAWVYTGGEGADFVATMRRLAAGTQTVAVVDDQIGSPTYVADLAVALLGIVDHPVNTRIVHAVNTGAISRYEQACAVFAEIGADPARVHPVSSAANPRPAARPSYSALSGVRSVRAGLPALRGWRDALSAALAGARRMTRPAPG